MVADSPRMIENRIARLRELMRGTLDRSKQPAIHAQIMEEVAKLKAIGRIVEDEGSGERR